jgi:hypothetical protein
MSKANRLLRDFHFEKLELRFEMDATIAEAKFDFGTHASPPESGYRRVSQSSEFTPSIGYGWSLGAISSYDRGVGTALTRDFN